MFRIDPLCGTLSLQTGSKIIAILDLILGILKLAWFIFMLVEYGVVSLQLFEEDGDSVTEANKHLYKLDLVAGPVYNTTSQETISSHRNLSILTLAAYNIEGTMVNIIIFVVLFVGARQRNITKCLIWFYLRGTVLILKFTVVIICLIAGRTFVSQLPFIAVMIVHVYGLWVVNEFIEELRRDRLSRARISIPSFKLTD